MKDFLKDEENKCEDCSNRTTYKEIQDNLTNERNRIIKHERLLQQEILQLKAEIDYEGTVAP